MPLTSSEVNLSLRCARMALNADRADPLMRQLAERLPALRKSAMLNQAELGALMHERRSDWSRSTVVKIENGKRRSISVGEWLDLAHVLGVPPGILVADPRYPSAVPLGLVKDALTGEEGPVEEVPAWDVLLWIAGAESRQRDEGPAVSGAAERLVAAGLHLKELLLRLGAWIDDYPAGALPQEEVYRSMRYHAAERPVIEELARVLGMIAGLGASLPVIPPWMYDKAREAGVTLPKAGG